MSRILLTHPRDTRDNYYGARALAGLRALGDVVLNAEARPLTIDEIIASAAECDVIVSDRQTPGYAELFRRLPRLVAFLRCAVDIRNVDVDAASDAGVLVTRASAGFMASVAEWIVGVMIDASRRISDAVSDYRAGRKPAPTMGRELRGATLGVIGYGQIGRYLCEIGLGLRMQILVHDPHAKVEQPGIEQVSFEALLEQSDYVVCLAVATAETENLMNAEAFARMKSTAYFINAARGDLVDEQALGRALDEGAIAGCAIDVGRDADQMPSLALARHPKVIATPHIGGLTPEAVQHQALETVRQAGEILAGRIPVGAVNADRVARLPRFAAAARTAK